MVKDRAAPSSSGLYSEDREAGAGGKFRNPPARRPSRTPYDRPPAKQSQARAVVQSHDGGWLWKLVDPACRLISSGATRILPSFISKSVVTDATPAAAAAETCENEGTGSEETANGDSEGCNSDLGISESNGAGNPRNEADTLTRNSGGGHLIQDSASNLPGGTDFSKIEQLVKGRTFSRDEINRLTKLLNSRVPDVSTVEAEENKQNWVAGGEGIGGSSFAHERSGMSAQEKQETPCRARVVTPKPLLQSAAIEDVGASPVDIARAYMEARTSDVGGIMPTDERAILRSGGLASEPSPLPQSSICWPGSIVQDQYSFQTPQTASRKYGLQSFQRTPYSRTIYSKSKSKVTLPQPDKNDYLKFQSAPRLQSRTPLFTQEAKVDNLFNDYGSVGPIRRARRKFLPEVPTRGSVRKGALDVTKSDPFLPSVKKNLVVGETSAEEGFQSIDSAANGSLLAMPTLQSSNPAVRAILEHLERNKPSPKEKSDELKLATAWKTISSSNETDSAPNEGANTSVPHKESYAQRTERGSSMFGVKVQQSCSTGIAEVNKDIEPSSTIDRSHASEGKFAQKTTSLGFAGNTQKATNEPRFTQNQINGKEAESIVPSSTGFNSLKKPPVHAAGSKPVLASISVTRPDIRPVFRSDSSCGGFSFPVSTSSGVLSEPPTPSIMPSTSATGLPQSKNVEAVPCYSFGMKKSEPALVFSFPAIADTSSSVQDDNASKIKFNFGSGKKSRISFSSVVIA